jgi:hypothetical protein
MDDERRPAAESPPSGPADAPEPEAPPPATPLVNWSAPAPDPGPWQYATPPGWTGLDVMSVFGRTIDTFIAHWTTYVALSLPAVVASLISLVVTSSRTASATTAQPIDLLALLFVPLGIFVSTAITMATDDIHSGRGGSAVRVLGPAVGRTIVVLLSAFVVWIVVFGLLIVPFVLLSLALYAGRNGPDGASAVVALIVLLIAGAVIFYVLFRWIFAPTAIAIERAGPLAGLNRSWKLTKGNLWRLGVLVIGIGLLTAPWTLAGSLLALSDNVAAGAIVSIVGALLFGALGPIVVTIAYGDVTGRWRAVAAAAEAPPPPAEWWAAPGSTSEAPAVEPAPTEASAAASEPQPPVAWPTDGPAPSEPAPMPAPPYAASPTPSPATSSVPAATAGVTRTERRVYVLGVFLVGVLLLIPSVALAGPSLANLSVAGVPIADRGKILAGTDRDPSNPCAPLNRATTFESTDTIYVGGYFSRAILPGQSATVHVQIDGAEAASAPLSATTQMVGCYYEQEALKGLGAAEYTIVVDDTEGVLAQGTFTVK